jgi:glucose-1-phosphate thymidylyltransferase
VIEMKTLILAGGRGTRLGELTKSVNKHLLPVGDWPVISHVFEMTIGISEQVLLITNPENISDFARVAADDTYPYSKFDVYYAAQPQPHGIANAITYGRCFCRADSVFIVLGDNIFHPNDAAEIRRICRAVGKTNASKTTFGAHVWVTKSSNPSAYGILSFEDGRPISIEEKPKKFSGDSYVITGAYLFDRQIWNILPFLRKSARGEYEITDVLTAYLEKDQLHCHILQEEWFDVGGSVDDYWQVVLRMRDRKSLYPTEEK